MKRFEYSILKTPLGFLGTVSSKHGLYSVIFPINNKKELAKKISRRFKKVTKSKKSDKAIKQLKKYFKGKNIIFKVKIDFSGISDFAKKVYSVVSSIPYGEKRSYGWVAQKVGGKRFSRAVGRTLKYNRIPIIIPCHRVVGKSDLGGFNLGIKNKIALLRVEKVLLK